MLISDETNALLHLASVQGLAAFNKVSTSCADLSRRELKRRILSELGESFQHGENLLSSLRTFNGVLSGSWVVNFVDPLELEPVNRIDILVGNNDFSLFIHWLETNEQANLLRCLTQVPEFTSGSYHCALEFQLPRTVVRVVRCITNDPCFLVANYGSTHLMNYISADHLLVAYPALTFKRECVIIGDEPNDLYGQTFRHLTRTGDSRALVCNIEKGCGGGMRWFDDGWSIAIGLESSFLIDGNVHWQLGGVKCNKECTSGERMVGWVDDK